jgi:hypothetical protein
MAKYRVRSKEGELEFKSFGEVEKAWLMGLVGPDDELLEDGKTTWRKAGSIPLLAQARRSGNAVWNGTQMAWMIFAVTFGSIALYCITQGMRKQSYVMMGIGCIIAFAVAGTLMTVTYRVFKKTRPH